MLGSDTPLCQFFPRWLSLEVTYSDAEDVFQDAIGEISNSFVCVRHYIMHACVLKMGLVEQNHEDVKGDGRTFEQGRMYTYNACM